MPLPCPPLPDRLGSAPVLACLVLALGLAACADAPRADALPAETFDVRGVFEGTRFDGAAVRVHHEAVPGHGDAMRMDLRLADTARVDGLRPGQKVRFRLAISDAGTEAFGFAPLPDSTRLHLDPAETPVSGDHATH